MSAEVEREDDESTKEDTSDYELLRDFISNQLAKFEMRELLHDRLALRARTQAKLSKKEADAQKGTHDLEHMYSLVECLPQRNRCTQPPREAFLTLANEAAAPADDPLKTLEKAFVLEEYAIELFAEHGDSAQSGTCETASAWALACSGIAKTKMSTSEKEMVQSKRIASQLHSILEWLWTGDWEGAQTGEEQKRGENQTEARRKRKSKRKRSDMLQSSNEDEGHGEGREGEKRARKKVRRNADGSRRQKEAGEYSSSDNYTSEEG